jgi:hypothetical protein
MAGNFRNRLVQLSRERIGAATPSKVRWLPAAFVITFAKCAESSPFA